MSTPLDFGPFLLLGVAARERLVAASARARMAAGAEILREGDAPADAYAIVRGRVRVTAGTPERTLAVLAAPALVGEMAVVTGEPRSASVHAAAAVEALRIPATALAEAIREEPAFADELRAFAALRLSTNFLRRSGPFADLTSAAIDELAATLRSVRYVPGETLLRQGERGDDAFLIRSGELEVSRVDATGERAVNTLGPGALFGELSVLTGAPRQATVRARTAVQAFRMPGEDVRAIVRRHRELRDRLESMMQSRHRPSRTGAVTVSPAPDDPESVILRDEREGTYIRLSREAHAIYEDLDGERTLRELAMAHFARTGAIDPQGVFATVATLQAAGMVSAPRIAASDEPHTRLLRLADLVLAPRLELRDADGLATALHRAFRPLFTPAGALGALLVGAVGTIALALTFRGASAGDFGLAGLAVTFGGLFVAGLGHEAAHAIATKAVGRHVGRAGIGLMFFTPVIYVDTSDAWLVDRRRRAMVNAVGPLFNLAFAGVCGLVALAGASVGEDVVQLAIWLGVLNLVSVAFNLSPLLEFDGYYVLSDLTNVNALRRKALRFVFGELVAHPRWPADRGEAGFLVYVIAVVLYIAAMDALTLIGIPPLVNGLLAERVGAEPRAALAIAGALAVSYLLVAPFADEVARARREPRA